MGYPRSATKFIGLESGDTPICIAKILASANLGGFREMY